jgi:dGTPase
MEWNKLLSEKRVRNFFVKPTPIERNNRTEFERDYDRAVFSTPLRRMHDKAQVFPLEPNDSVRTRLTHSLEVSTVARDMARAICSQLETDKIISGNEAKAIEVIAATCGLIHDLGNPPFGHAGEEAVAEWFKDKSKDKSSGEESTFFDFANGKEQLKNDLIKFNGNAQTLRLVSKLQILSDLYGLNFTCATMSAACKYTATSDKIDETLHEKKEVGYFASEEPIVDLVRNETGTKESRNPITYIVEAADDIVYSVGDLEDGVKKGVITWEGLKEKLIKYSQGNTEMIERCFEKAEKLIDKKDERVELKGKSKDEAMAKAFGIWAVGESVHAVIETFKDKYKDIMSGSYHNELFKDSKASSLIKACKEAGQKHVYCAEQNLKNEVMARHVIHELMDIFWEGASKERGKRTRFEEKIYSL